MSDRPKPTHVYIARKECGCCIGVVTDFQDKSTGAAVAEFIADGLTISRNDWSDYKENICNEPTFMSCPHGQLKLFEEKPKDPLLEEAKERSRKQGFVSVSYLQRSMRIGYTRAARLVDYIIEDKFCGDRVSDTCRREIIEAVEKPLEQKVEKPA